jgi:hypothetical protein
VTAAQVREAARLLDQQRTPDEEVVNLIVLDGAAQLRIGPLPLYERPLPLSLTPKRFLIEPDGSSVSQEPLR